MSEQFALKLPVGDVPARTAMEIKKMTGLGLGDIKKRAANDEYLLTSPYGNTDGLVLINEVRREMKKQGIAVRLFQNDREESLEYFDNVEETYRMVDAADSPD